jgi:lysozyme
MTTKEILAALIKESEGCKLKAYRCPSGVLTIGWGQTGKGIVEGLKWTQQQADSALDATIDKVLADMFKASKSLLNESPEKQAAIADFVYNLGITNYKKSTLKLFVDSRQWEQARTEILKWNRGGGKVLPGLVKRRAKEAELLAK